MGSLQNKSRHLRTRDRLGYEALPDPRPAKDTGTEQHPEQSYHSESYRTNKMTTEAHKKQKMAHHIVKQAVDEGELTRPSACDLCTFRPKNDLIMAHHWQGYDSPLDIIWICRSCNRVLSNKHDGSLTFDEAKDYVLSRKTASKPKRVPRINLQSRIAEIAASQNIKTPQELSWAVRITVPTARKVWTGNLATVHAKTLLKIKIVLNCSFEDLYTVN